MARRILVFDTSVLCCWLNVPGKETAGTASDRWDRARVDSLVRNERAKGSTFVLPLATVIETGNHIAQAANQRYELAIRFCKLLVQTAQANTPWTAFTEQAEHWTAASLVQLASTWPDLAKSGTSIGDATIKNVANYSAVAGFHVNRHGRCRPESL